MEFFRDTIRRIEESAALAGLPHWLVDELSEPKDVKEIKIRVLTQRGRETFNGVRVWQTNPSSTGDVPYKGGLRYMKYNSREEMITAMRALALDMTLKNALHNILFGGAKGCLNFDPAERSKEELEAITKELTLELLFNNALGPNIDVLGPDYGTNPETMKWIYQQYARMNIIMHRPSPAAIVTGKPVELGGFPGREDATARGGLIIFNEIIKPDKPMRFAVQGFGNVGENLIRLLSADQFRANGEDHKIVAVSDAESGLINARGMTYDELAGYYRERKTFLGCPFGDAIRPEEIVLAGDYDVFVTAAKEELLNGQNAEKLKAKVVLELGNGAVTYAADKIFNAKGIPVIPDILANAGGVIVSFFEWRKNLSDVLHKVDLGTLLHWGREELSKIMKNSAREVLKIQEEFGCTLRQAAYIAALRRLEESLRGKHGYK